MTTATDQVFAALDVQPAGSSSQHLQLWDALASLEVEARSRRLDTMPAKTQAWLDRKSTRLVSTWRVESSTTEKPATSELSPETKALRDWLLSDSLDWDAVEHARTAAWGD